VWLRDSTAEAVVELTDGSEYRFVPAAGELSRALAITLAGNAVLNPARHAGTAPGVSLTCHPSGKLRFTLATPGRTTLTVYASNGALIRTLLDGYREAGGHTLVWNRRDSSDRTVAAGPYIVSLSTPNSRLTTLLLSDR
jgi:hypothetical protein